MDTISLEFRVKRLKLCRNCAFSKKFYTRELGEVFIFGAVQFLFFPCYSSFSQVLSRLAARKTEDIKFHFTCSEFNLHLNVIKFKNIITRFLGVVRIIGFQNFLPMFQLKPTRKMFQNCKLFYELYLLNRQRTCLLNLGFCLVTEAATGWVL